LEFDEMTAIAILGAGRMASALARTLLANGHDVHVWNRTVERARALEAAGAIAAPTAERAVASAEVVIVNLLDYAVSDSQLLRRPVADALKGKVLIQLTSGSPSMAQQTGTWATRNGTAYLDGAIMATPNFIGRPETLILYSGSGDAYERHSSTLNALAGRSAFVGEDFGLASALDCALLSQMWGTLFGTLQAIAINRAENIPQETYEAYLPLMQPVIDAAALDLMQRLKEGRDAGDAATLATVGVHSASFRHMLDIVADRQLNPAVAEGFNRLFRMAIEAGHGADDFAVLARFMGIR
jgi:3-hydroxyisobutyrate dehydrogenase-like beta-hydroxyacid dehydrogenase